jgi:hypothetical protein
MESGIDGLIGVSRKVVTQSSLEAFLTSRFPAKTQHSITPRLQYSITPTRFLCRAQKCCSSM